MLSTYLISKDMLSVTITTTYAIANSLLNNNKYNYFDFVSNTDIVNRLKIIHEFVEEIMDDRKCQKSRTLRLCIESVESSIKEINNILERINTNYMNYRNSWFRYFYRFDCSNDIDKLKNKIEILEARSNMLLKIKSAIW